MPVPVSVKRKLVDDTLEAIARARVLYDRVALHGASVNGGATAPLSNPDRREMATFIFFEVAAKYEDFCAQALLIEVRSVYGVQPGRGKFILGSSDKGLTGFMGWASPKMISDRAEHLFGRTGFFARLEYWIGATDYQRLSFAHKIRNRIAHSGPNARKDYSGILHQLTVPVAARKGLSVGRLLQDYPAAAAQNDRWFYRLLAAYEHTVREFDRRVR